LSIDKYHSIKLDGAHSAQDMLHPIHELMVQGLYHHTGLFITFFYFRIQAQSLSHSFIMLHLSTIVFQQSIMSMPTHTEIH